MKAFGVTDRGCVRQENQDAFQILQIAGDCLICVICDGMGGANAGAVASRLACDAFCSFCTEQLPAQKDMQKLLRSAVTFANETVYRKANADAQCFGMGTTLTALAMVKRNVYLANVGDSRIYLVNDAGIRRLTTDHSMVELMIQRGELTREQARFFPGKNLITRAVGTEQTVECDIFTCSYTPGDRYLLCSDGLSNVLAEQELLFELAHGTPETCCDRLLQIALGRGAPDNVTVALVCDD